MTDRKKLKLNKDTLRDLTSEDLQRVLGGTEGQPAPTNRNPCAHPGEDPSDGTCTAVPTDQPCVENPSTNC